MTPSQTLQAELDRHGRGHLKVKDEAGVLVVSSPSSDKGNPSLHFRLKPEKKGYRAERWEEGAWKRLEISGTISEVIDRLAQG